MPDIVLRDIQQPAAPAWWPPAPGWWWLAAALCILLAAAGLYAWLRARRRQAWRRMFDTAVDAAPDPSARIAAMSALLRRAARRVRPDADRLEGDAWLAFLDAGATEAGFSDGPGAVLREGAFKRDPGPVDIVAAQRLARARFVALMQAGR
nr:DUF4381 family protein [Luteimonas deserti]